MPSAVFEFKAKLYTSSPSTHPPHPFSAVVPEPGNVHEQRVGGIRGRGREGDATSEPWRGGEGAPQQQRKCGRGERECGVEHDTTAPTANHVSATGLQYGAVSCALLQCVPIGRVLFRECVQPNETDTASLSNPPHMDGSARQFFATDSLFRVYVFLSYFISLHLRPPFPALRLPQKKSCVRATASGSVGLRGHCPDRRRRGGTQNPGGTGVGAAARTHRLFSYFYMFVKLFCGEMFRPRRISHT